MKKAFRNLGLMGLAALVAWGVGTTGLAVDRSALTGPGSTGALAVAAQAAGQSEVTVLLSTRKGAATAVARSVKSLGGTVRTALSDADFLVARIPTAALKELERSSLIRAMALDRPVRLDPTAMRPLTETAKAPASAAEPALSLRVTRGEIRAPQLESMTGHDGSGTVIAVLDTGVDPDHPALKRTPGGETKIIDWQDFTGEGDVATKETYTEAIPGIPTAGGTYKLGTFTEAQIPKGQMEQDLNRNGKADDQFKLLLTDSRAPGVYDTAYVDLNQNGDFSDEKPMGVYKESMKTDTFGEPGKGVNFVITRIDRDGSGLNIGYDGGQHGTHVAGIAAASGPVTGVAPGAKIIAIKVLTSGGSGGWSGIIEGMHYAASQGAQVINLSLGGLAELNDGSDPQSIFINELSAKTGALFSIAGGNSGPGLNTMGLPAVAGAAITSGAYISKNTWKIDYGLDVPQDGLWYFSSAGPRDDGGLKPNVVAPGTANSAIPTWAGQYAVFQGTSMATPQTSGAAALLIGAARNAGMKPGPDALRMALEVSARRLPGYGWYEQGHGLIQLDAAWGALKQIVTETNPDLVSAGKAKAGTAGTGLYAREFSLRGNKAGWSVTNRGYQQAELALSYLPGNGLTLSGPDRMRLPALMRREVNLRVDHSAAPGVYDALVQARVPGQRSYAAQYLATVVVPHDLSLRADNRVTGIKGTLGPARYGRHFVRVPSGTAELQVVLRTPGNQGRVRLMAYTPDGLPAGDTPYAGAPSGPESQTLTIPSPQPGVWEINSYASHGALNFGLAENHYEIDLAARGIYASPSRLDLPFAFNQSLTRKITFTNTYGDVKVVAEGAGFVQPEQQRLEVEHNGFKHVFFSVKPGAALLSIAVGEVSDPAAQLDTGLYYNDPKLGGWRSVGQRIGARIELAAPEPGQYAVEVVGRAVPSGKTGFVYSQTLVTGGEGVKVESPTALRKLGDRWTVPVTLRVPPRLGQYQGAVLLKDAATGKVLAVVPVEAK